MDCSSTGPCSKRAARLLAVLALAFAAWPAAAAPPVVDSFPVYRTYPDNPIQIVVGATDPEGGSLTFTSDSLPETAMLDPVSGLFEWQPDPTEVGAYEIEIEVTDDALPPETGRTLLSIRVQPTDTCNMPTCDPATGCVDELPPIPTTCCSAEPTVRVPEPPAYCDGLVPPELLVDDNVIHVGRNAVGFGRIQNCDLLQILPGSGVQGAARIRISIEARCVEQSVPLPFEVALLQARLVTVDREPLNLVVFDDQRQISLSQRSDGFWQAYHLFYTVNPDTVFEDLENREAELSVTLIHRPGTPEERIFEQKLRVTLTHDELADLPNPDVEDVPADEAGCVGCHRPLDAGSQERVGIEEAHPGLPLTCTFCHGGDGGASTRAAAHVSPGSGPSFLKRLSSDELDAVDPAYLRFINPGDFRIADQTCGLSACHQSKLEDVKLSTMSTYGGHYTLPRYLAGSQGRDPEVAAVDVTDPNYDAATAPHGAIESLAALRGPDPAADRSDIHTNMDIYLPKSCPTCHLNDFGRNAAAGAYRSSGCTACHMVYDDDGRSRSDDPTVDPDFPPHPVKHQITTQIPTEQCAHCHFQGGRIGLHYRGIREGGFPPETTPPHGVTLGVPIYGHDADYYFSDEDDRNAVDETPPDLHHEAGMVCMDCHVGGDVHGDGNLYRSERYQVGIRCEDCHGTVREEIAEVDGSFVNSRGYVMRRLSRDGASGDVMLELATQPGTLLEVPQVKRLLDEGANPDMNEAMGIDENDFSHTDSMECYTCHTSWRLNCFGCHVTVNDTRSARNATTGEFTQGDFDVWREDFTLDFFALGMNERGKISPLCSSMSMFMGYVDEQGNTIYEDRVRTSFEGRKGFGWNPFHHHTVTREPQGCDRCHPVAGAGGGAGPGDPPNAATLSATYGFGGAPGFDGSPLVVTDGDGTPHDVTRFLDDDGELISEFPHPGTGPVPASIRERAMAVLIPEPDGLLLELGALGALLALARRRSRRHERIRAR